MDLRTGTIIEVTFDDPELRGQSIEALLIGKETDSYVIICSDNNKVGYIEENSIQKVVRCTNESIEMARKTLDTWEGTKPLIIQ